MDLLSGATETQKEAITHVNGPLLVIAGAGSGKTRVITHRIGYLIEQGISPYNILALTFTNKAAKEMKERVDKFCKLRGMWISTFHSMCARILRSEITHLGYSNTFTIYDKQDQVSTIKGVMKILELDPAHWIPGKVGNAISQAKNSLISASEYEEKMPGYYFKVVGQIYEKYETVLKENNALDFDDLLLKVVELFQTRPDILKVYQEKFRYILIDEYQDTNHTQYTMASLLAQRHMNICATGDPDQSIYSWRGADLRNILDFEKDYPDTRIVKLEQNYRSTKTILKAASEIINNNTMRKAKDLWTNNQTGNKIDLIKSLDENQEAESIKDRIKELQKDQSANYSDIAIFYRTNAQSRVIEEKLRNNNIPYTIIGSVEFYRRKEVKDILAYLKLCVNPEDNIALTRIINIPTRGIGKVSMEKIMNWAYLNKCSILNALFVLTDTETKAVDSFGQEIDTKLLKGKSKLAVKQFVNIINKLRSMSDKKVKNVVETCIQLTNYKEFLHSTEGPKSTEKIENVEELINAANEYDKSQQDGTLSGFLEDVSLVADIDNWDEQVNAVTMMTLHAAKGLEFPVVFLTGLEDGILPHSQSMDNEDGLEEERRLCYVGITRAEKELIITYVKSRFRHGQRFPSAGSRFLREIPEDIINFIDNTVFIPPVTPQFEFESYPEFDEVSNFGIKRGDKVQHQAFGVGRVLDISGYGKTTKANVQFNIGGTKSLMLKYAKLEKLL